MKKLQDVGTFLICLAIATAIVTVVNYRENAYEETNTVSDNNSSVSTTEVNEETKEEDELDEEVKRNTITNVNVTWMFREYLKASENVYRTAEVLLDEYGSKEPKDIGGGKQDSKEVKEENILTENELSGGKVMLTSAALTYVASVATAIIQIVRLVLIYGRRND